MTVVADVVGMTGQHIHQEASVAEGFFIFQVDKAIDHRSINRFLLLFERFVLL
ncbi:hypothetical protein D3C87_2017800 [compost metagenome]